MRRGALHFLVPAILLVSSRTAEAEPTAAERALATSLFRSGRELLEAGRYAEACEKLAESQRLDPGGGTLLNLALCHERLGKTATAWAELNESLALALREGRTDREDLAREHLAALEGVLPKLVVLLRPEADVGGLAITLDTTVIRHAALGTPIPVDPGRHVLLATAPGYLEQRLEVEVAPGGQVTVEVPALARSPSASPASLPGTPAETRSPAAPTDTAAYPESVKTTSHRGQWGIAARGDIDGRFRGAILVLGPTFGVTDWLEPIGAAMIGPTSGFYVGGSLYPFPAGRWKPLVTVGMPVYFVDAPRPSVHVAAGVAWDPIRNVGVFATLGGQLHPSAPRGYESAELVPSIGVQARR